LVIVHVLYFCKQENSLVGQFVCVLHFFMARLKQSGRTKTKTSQFTRREKESERESE